MTARVVLWRHGNTDWNNDRRVQGQTDVPLNDLGRAQATGAASVLAHRKPIRLISSDLSRAVATAAALADLTGLTMERDVRLRERHFGRWQGLLMPEIQQRFPASHARWSSGDPDPGDGIESLSDLGKRTAEVIRQAAERNPDGLTVLATHGGAAKYGVATLLGWSEEAVSSLRVLSNCHWTEVMLGDRGWQLYAHNVGG